MQKKIIALAVAGLMSGAAFAQSTTTISGLVRMSVEQYKLSNVGAANVAGPENRVSDQSSFIAIKAREDMGNGSYAGFVADLRFSPDLGAASASGNTNINIGGKWGELAAGRQDLHYGSSIESYGAYTLQNILSNGIFSQVWGYSIANATRTPNVVMYNSPNMSGFTARVALSTAWAATEGRGTSAAGTTNPSSGSATNIELKYANGPIFAGYSYWNATAEGGKAVGVIGAATATTQGALSAHDQRGDTLQGSYAVGAFKAGLGWNRSRISWSDVEVRRTAWVLPVSFTMGAHQFAATYASAGNLTGAGGGVTATLADTGASAWTLAYSNALSKRTNVGVSYTKLDNKANGAYNLFGLAANGATPVGALNTALGADVSQLSVNMNHSF